MVEILENLMGKSQQRRNVPARLYVGTDSQDPHPNITSKNNDKPQNPYCVGHAQWCVFLFLPKKKKSILRNQNSYQLKESTNYS